MSPGFGASELAVEGSVVAEPSLSPSISDGSRESLISAEALSLEPRKVSSETNCDAPEAERTTASVEDRLVEPNS
jgi:hypothetical protein